MPIYKNIGTDPIILPDLSLTIDPGVTFAVYRYYNHPDLELVDDTVEVVPLCILEGTVSIDISVSPEVSINIHPDCKKIEIFDISASLQVSANVKFSDAFPIHRRTLSPGDRLVIYNKNNKIKTLHFASDTNVTFTVVQHLEE